MGLFTKRRVSQEAEREALALEAAVMARIATITTTHDKAAEEDEADFELLASMSSVTGLPGLDPVTREDMREGTLLPDALLAEASNPSAIHALDGTVPDLTSRIPAPLIYHPPARTEAAPLTQTGAGSKPEPRADPYSMLPAGGGLAEHQAAAPVFEPFAFGTASLDLPVADALAAVVPVPADAVPADPVPAYPVVADPVTVLPVATADLPLETCALGAELVQPVASLAPDAVHYPAVPSATDGTSTPFALTSEQIAANALLQETTKHLRSIGAVNILVAGQTGVGKSTLVNSVFGEEFAATSAGSPVTQHAEWFASDSVPLRILDTRGLEAKDYSVTLNALQAEIINSRAQHDERHQLHMAWVCISTPSSRVQECEIDIIKLLNRHEIPVIIVLTKYDDDEDFPDIVRQIMDTRGARFTDVVPVRALARKSRPAHGLEELVTATFTALPVAHKAAFAAAQKISRDLNRTTAETYVTIAASAAAAASVIPIPFADMATLAPIQASMLVGISNAFGVTLEKAQIMQLITTVLGCLAITMAGGWIVGSVLKFIPGPGSVIGAMLNATLAGALTRTLGRTYIRFLYAFLEVNRRLPTADEIFDLFPTFYKAGRNKVAAA